MHAFAFPLAAANDTAADPRAAALVAQDARERTFRKLATWGQISAAGSAGRYVITPRGRANYAAILSDTDHATPNQTTEPRS
jgi:hypothetical protein